MTTYASLEDAIVNGYGNERTFVCHAHSDHQASASVNITKGLWVCYACDARGTTEGLIELTPDLVRQRLREQERRSREAQHPTYPESWLNIFTASGPGEYWLSRFNEHTCSHFQLGQLADRSASVYPMRDNQGSLLGIVRRDTSDGATKYVYPFNVSVRDMLFNYAGSTQDDVVLTEGATDAMAVWEASTRFAPMAIYGSSMRDTQVELLARYAPKRIILAFDRDRAGLRLTVQAIEKLQQRLPHVPLLVTRWRGYKDLSEMPPEARNEVLHEALASHEQVWQAARHER